MDQPGQLSEFAQGGSADVEKLILLKKKKKIGTAQEINAKTGSYKYLILCY